MKDDKTRNLSLCKKRRRMKEQFPDLEISKTVCHKIVDLFIKFYSLYIVKKFTAIQL